MMNVQEPPLAAGGAYHLASVRKNEVARDSIAQEEPALAAGRADGRSSSRIGPGIPAGRSLIIGIVVRSRSKSSFSFLGFGMDIPPLDIQALLARIPGSEPAGENLWSSIRDKLDSARKEIRPEAFPPDDPRRPGELKKADWPFIVREVQQTLVERSKDIRLAARLTEAQTKCRGFAGLRDGLRLMRLLVEQCWDRLQPALDEEGDLGNRAAPFHWLSDENGGAYFPNTVRAVPLVNNDADGEYGWIHFYGPKNTSLKASEAAALAIDQMNAEKAVAKTPPEKCQANLTDLTQSEEELAQLEKVLDKTMGEQSPALNSLRDAIQDCLVLAQLIAKRRGQVPGQEATVAAGKNQPAAPGAPPPPEQAELTRDAVYQRLAAAAAVLQKLEPHSPIPYLIRRAVDLGAMPFPQLMRALISDAKTLDEMNRGLGIKEPPPEKEKEKK
jgi:type VI secretion system protein ImpA